MSAMTYSGSLAGAQLAGAGLAGVQLGNIEELGLCGEVFEDVRDAVWKCDLSKEGKPSLVSGYRSAYRDCANVVSFLDSLDAQYFEEDNPPCPDCLDALQDISFGTGQSSPTGDRVADCGGVPITLGACSRTKAEAEARIEGALAGFCMPPGSELGPGDRERYRAAWEAERCRLVRYFCTCPMDQAAALAAQQGTCDPPDGYPGDGGSGGGGGGSAPPAAPPDGEQPYTCNEEGASSGGLFERVISGIDTGLRTGVCLFGSEERCAAVSQKENTTIVCNGDVIEGGQPRPGYVPEWFPAGYTDREYQLALGALGLAGVLLLAALVRRREPRPAPVLIQLDGAGQPDRQPDRQPAE